VKQVADGVACGAPPTGVGGAPFMSVPKLALTPQAVQWRPRQKSPTLRDLHYKPAPLHMLNEALRKVIFARNALCPNPTPTFWFRIRIIGFGIFPDRQQASDARLPKSRGMRREEGSRLKIQGSRKTIRPCTLNRAPCTFQSSYAAVTRDDPSSAVAPWPP
jgi:hypothetical protein